VCLPAAEYNPKDGLTFPCVGETLNCMVEHYDEHLDHLFQALANRTRREIMGLLAQRPHHISELVPRFDMSLAAVSKHIQSLERARLVTREIVGRNHVCHLNADALSEAYEWLSAYESFWGERLDALESILSETEGGQGGGAKK
jgi:DNA-binding transcriptional ArsR family regulator